MFKLLEDRTICATRGDAVYFTVEKRVGDALYQFQPGDVLRMKICKKKEPEKVVLMRDFVVEEETTCVNIFLDRLAMKFGEITGKPVDYWYEIELNPDTAPDTFIGYNEDGPAVFRLYPETKDIIEGEIENEAENSAVSRMVVTYVHEYMGENAEVLISRTFDEYVAAHPPTKGEDGVGIDSAELDGDKNLVLNYSDGSSAVVGRVGGEDGKNGKNGVNGVTFTPSVDADGNLSWMNFGGLENPATVNIRGPVGPKGEDGRDGADGSIGADGYTPQKGVDYFTDADKDELTGLVLDTFATPAGITFSKVGSTVTATFSEADGVDETVTVQLDAYDRPLWLAHGDRTCYFSWEGFD